MTNSAWPSSISEQPVPTLPAGLVALLDEATVEIVRFDAELGRDIAPFAPLLLRSESAASSKIENLTASAKAIALAELGDPSKHNAGIIVANTRAMEAAIALAKTSTQMHFSICTECCSSRRNRAGPANGEQSRSGLAEATMDRTEPCSFHRITNMCNQTLPISSRFFAAMIYPCSCRLRSHTRSSKPFTRSPMETGASAGR